VIALVSLPKYVNVAHFRVASGAVFFFLPIWTYGIQLWGTTSNSNVEILERFQSKVLRLIVDAPWYVPNSVIRKDLQIATVK
jgi:hypothetical protein